jgi:hypothetical protein
MAGLSAQLPSLIGVLVGASASLMVTTVGDRSRFRRDELARWRDRRLAVYTDYARAMKANVNVMYRWADYLGNRSSPHELTPERARPLLAASVEARDQAWETLSLVGSRDVAAAANAWFDVVVVMERSIQASVEDTAVWDELFSRHGNARQRFYDAARADLALSDGTRARATS